MTTAAPLTPAAFDELAAADDRRLELIDGEVIEKVATRPRHNSALSRLDRAAGVFITQRGLGGVLPVTLFQVGDQRMEPDLAIILGDRWAGLDPDVFPVPFAPTVAAEVASPSDLGTELLERVLRYLNAGTAEVWLLYPTVREVHVYTADHLRRLREHDTLTSPLLPGWSLPLAELFAW